MSAEALSTTPAEDTVRRMRAAMEAGDIEGVMATTAPDVVLRSPITDKFQFRGHAELRELMEVVLETVADIRYYEEIGDDRTRAVFYRARVGSQPVDEACLIRLDDQARITEFTIWYRPLPGLASVAAGLAPRLTRRHSRARAAVVAAGTGLIALLAVRGEPPLLRLVRPGRPR